MTFIEKILVVDGTLIVPNILNNIMNVDGANSLITYDFNKRAMYVKNVLVKKVLLQHIEADLKIRGVDYLSHIDSYAPEYSFKEEYLIDISKHIYKLVTDIITLGANNIPDTYEATYIIDLLLIGNNIHIKINRSYNDRAV